jgi:hypothetical protein
LFIHPSEFIFTFTTRQKILAPHVPTTLAIYPPQSPFFLLSAHFSKQIATNKMRLLGLILALLGILVSSAAGECQARSAPDEDFSFVNRPLTDEPTNSIFGTGDGCISSTWPLGRPHIQSRPSDQGFSVWSFHVVNPANLNEYVLFRFVMGTPDAYELKEATNGYISLVMDIRFADGLILRHVINSQLGQEGAVDLWTKGWATWTKWGSTGAVFHGSRDGKEMTVEKGWDGGRTTIYGSLVMKFVSLSHATHHPIPIANINPRSPRPASPAHPTSATPPPSKSCLASAKPTKCPTPPPA